MGIQCFGKLRPRVCTNLEEMSPPNGASPGACEGSYTSVTRAPTRRAFSILLTPIYMVVVVGATSTREIIRIRYGCGGLITRERVAITTIYKVLHLLNWHKIEKEL